MEQGRRPHRRQHLRRASALWLCPDPEHAPSSVRRPAWRAAAVVGLKGSEGLPAEHDGAEAVREQGRDVDGPDRGGGQAEPPTHLLPLPRRGS